MAIAATHPAAHIGALARTEPDLLMTAAEGALCGAIWSHPPVEAEVFGLAQHAIVLHLAGSTLVEKWCGGRLAGHRSRIGSISLVPAGMTSAWVLRGHSKVAHVYVDLGRLAHTAAAAGDDGASGTAQLRDFFAEEDDIAVACVRSLIARTQAGTLDVLAHDEVMARLLRHLLHRYAADRPIAAASVRLTLTAATLKRLFAHIDEHVAGALRLAELAALARLSDDHFLRAFKAAVGQTPHQYVLDRRLGYSQRLLAHSRMPVAEVARTAGFRGASHFAAAFRQRLGTTPSAWRADRR